MFCLLKSYLDNADSSVADLGAEIDPSVGWREKGSWASKDGLMFVKDAGILLEIILKSWPDLETFSGFLVELQEKLFYFRSRSVGD